jgi:predicted phage terminase large subunit-like protein
VTDEQLLRLLESDPAGLTHIVAALPPQQRELALTFIKEMAHRHRIERARTDFRSFCRVTQPGYIDGQHLRLLTGKLNDVAEGRIKRLIVCLPPRHSKSRHSSELFPAYFLGRFPDQPIMTVSHTTDLATVFGRFVRDMIKSSEYQEIFPDTQIRGDQSAAADWSTTRNGKYYAAGVGSSLAGRGAKLLVVDDMVNEQTALQGQYRPEIFEKIYDWYLLARQRLMPGGSILIVNTRWAVNDPTGLIIERSKEDWEIINLPAVWPADETHPEERILWPEFWTREEIFAIRAEMPPLKWAATYQQAPEQGGGTIIDEDWIKRWTKSSPPPVEEIIITLDPAFSEKERADPSAVGVFGIFSMKPNQLNPSDPEASDKPKRFIIALDVYETWADFPDLKSQCVDLVRKWKPDAFLIEDKASGVPLFQELVSIGAPVSLFKVTRGKKGAPNDKIARVNSIAPIVRSGLLYFPEGFNWADKAVKQFVTFPQVANDDMTDVITMALVYFRNVGAIELDLDDALAQKDDENEDEDLHDSMAFSGYHSVVRR